MLNIIVFLLELVDQYAIWLYIACVLIVLYNLRNFVTARRSRVNTIFSVEREVSAHREGRAMSNVGLVLGLVAVVLAFQYYVMPSVDVAGLVEPTPTITLPIPTETPRATPTATPDQVSESMPDAETQPTATPVPTEIPVVEPTAVPTEAPPPPASACGNPNICISSPGSGAQISGAVSIRGTARHENFQFYKIEYGQGEDPQAWHSIGSTVSSQISDGTLAQFDSQALPNGVYWLQLTVVDITGNFPPPHRVRITIAN